jgi:CRISPR-associated protein Csx10
MKQYKMALELKSPTLIGSGEGFGAIIDTDIVFDGVGIPFVPAKRIKGCLRDSAQEVQDLFESAHIDFPLSVEKTFGKPGSDQSAPVYFSNLTIENYEDNKDWLAYFIEQYPDVLSRDLIVDMFTERRQQTAIDPSKGVAYDHSLRTIRVVKKGTIFYGMVQIEDEDEAILNTLALACLNFRCMGTKRNRGFGSIDCSLWEEETNFSKKLEKTLEVLCTN